MTKSDFRQGGLKREDTDLTSLTKEIDDFILDEAHKHGNTNQHKIAAIQRSNSLYRLSQQEIEDLILNEHTIDKSSCTTKGNSQLVRTESRLAESVAQEWDLQNQQGSWSNMNTSYFNIIKAKKSLRDQELKRSGTGPSAIYYDNADEELLKSIESSYSGSMPGQPPMPKADLKPGVFTKDYWNSRASSSCSSSSSSSSDSD